MVTGSPFERVGPVRSGCSNPKPNGSPPPPQMALFIIDIFYTQAMLSANPLNVLLRLYDRH